MENIYTNEQLNEILLTKKVEDFYFVITQDIRDELLSEEEASRMLQEGEMSDETKNNLNETSDALTSLFGLGNSDITRLLASLCDVNHFRVVVRIDNLLYDVSRVSFVDLSKEKVVRFDSLSKYYNNDNCRPMLFPVEAFKGLTTEPSVTLDYDDLEENYKYQKFAYDDYTGIDLTEEFKKEIGLTGPTRKRMDK